MIFAAFFGIMINSAEGCMRQVFGKLWVDVLLLGLVFLGVTVHFYPPRRGVVHLASPALKASLKKPARSRYVTERFLEAFGRRFRLPQDASRLSRAALAANSYIDILHAQSAMVNLESAFWRRLRSGGLLRFDGGAPDEPSDALDYDFTADVRVNNPYNMMQGQPDMAVGPDGTIYVCWIDENNSDSYGVYFSKSTDGGATWLPRVAVDTQGPNYYPQMAVYGSGSSARIYIAYTYEYDASNYDYDVYVAYSTDGGSTWNYAGVGVSSYYENMPHIAVDDEGYVYVAYTYADWSSGSCDAGDVNYYVVYRYSANSGASWSSQITLISSGCPVGLPSLAMEGGGTGSIMHLTYVIDISCGGDPTNYDARYRKYSGAGSGSPTLIYSDRTICGSSYDDYVIPDGIAVGSDGNPQIVYVVSGSDSGDVYYRRSSNGGNSFEPAVVISAGSTPSSPSIASTTPLWLGATPATATQTSTSPGPTTAEKASTRRRRSTGRSPQPTSTGPASR